MDWNPQILRVLRILRNQISLFWTFSLSFPIISYHCHSRCPTFFTFSCGPSVHTKLCPATPAIADSNMFNPTKCIKVGIVRINIKVYQTELASLHSVCYLGHFSHSTKREPPLSVAREATHQEAWKWHLSSKQQRTARKVDEKEGILFLGVAPRPMQLLHEVVLGPKSIHSEVSDLAWLARVICLVWLGSEQARIAYHEALPPQCNGYSGAMEFHWRDRGCCLSGWLLSH